MNPKRITVDGKFAGTIEQVGTEYKARTALSIERNDSSWVRYPTYEEAYQALVKWARS